MLIKKIIPGVLASIFIFSSSFAAESSSFTFSCDSTPITLGMDTASLQKACGKPISTYKRMNRNYLRYKMLNGTVETDARFKFADDKLVYMSYKQEDEAKD